jgi:hypothetical protein
MHLAVGTDENHKNLTWIFGAPAKIQTKHPMNTSIERYGYTTLNGTALCKLELNPLNKYEI